jgi:hypothetical protein
MAQAETVRWCQAGLGHERHLLALRALALERAQQQREEAGHPGEAEAGTPSGAGLPSIFTDRGYALLTTSTLSTSCLRSDSIVGFSFGPVTPDGYGIGYVYDKAGVTVNVTSFARAAALAAPVEAAGGGGDDGEPAPDCEAFAAALGEALSLIEAMLDSKPRSKL